MVSRTSAVFEGVSKVVLYHDKGLQHQFFTYVHVGQIVFRQLVTVAGLEGAVTGCQLSIVSNALKINTNTRLEYLCQ